MKRIYKRKSVPFSFKHKTLILAVEKAFKILMAVMGIICLFSVLAVDSATYIPLAVCVASGMLMFACAYLHDAWVMKFMGEM